MLSLWKQVKIRRTKEEIRMPRMWFKNFLQATKQNENSECRLIWQKNVMIQHITMQTL